PALICASAARSETACLCAEAHRSTPPTSRPKARCCHDRGEDASDYEAMNLTNDREWPRSDAHQVAVKTRTRGLSNSQTGPSGRKTKRADTLSNQQAMPETGNQGGLQRDCQEKLDDDHRDAHRG